MNIPAEPTDGKSFRILVIEDDPAIAQPVLSSLSLVGLECRYAPDGLIGLEAFHEITPHLVLLDLMMPGMNGREVCRRIRETSTVPIILMTAKAEEGDQMLGFKAGADDYVTKPFTVQVLAARVVARLRRTYKYSTGETAEPAAVATAAPSALPDKIPAGWASCDICGYMGPRFKFEQKGLEGIHLACPSCHQSDHFTFALG